MEMVKGDLLQMGRDGKFDIIEKFVENDPIEERTDAF